MSCQPRIDTEWAEVLAHRPPRTCAEAVARFAEHGITPAQVRAVLADGGDALYAAASGGVDGWAEQFGGPLGVALLAAEVSAYTAHLTARAAGVRALAVDRLLDDLSAVTVASRLGVSRQKVYDLARGGLTTPFVDRVLWRNSEDRS
jgi:hypothetical protein